MSESLFSDFFKEDDNNIIWRIVDLDSYGTFLFSFDKKTIYNFWSDYPQNLSLKQKEIFDYEFPDMAKLKNYGIEH